MHYYDQRKRTALLLACSLLPLVCLAQQRNKTEALSKATDFCKSNFQSDIELGSYVKSSSELSWSTKLSTTKEAYYIFNGQDNGFVIVSGDERMPTILAYSDNSSFECEELPPAVRYWLECYEETYLRMNGTNPPSSAEQDLAWAPNNVEPLLVSTQWGQGDPFNKFCPSFTNQKCLTGCVATAMAQVLRYHRYPEHGEGRCDYYSSTNRLHVTRDLSKDFYDWDSMLDSYSKGNYSESNVDAVATLMASCGASVEMDYGTNSQGGSGAYQTDLLKAFVENFGYDPDAAVLIRNYFTTKEWHDLLIKELVEGRPVNYAGQSSRDGGHSFVLDGYRVNSANVYPDYHVNWGWNGNCDGYYQIADLLPKENGQNATMDGFNSSQQMTIGIQPNDGIDLNSIVLATEKLHTSTSITKPGSTIQVYTASLCNFSYHVFSGVFSVTLVDEAGNEFVVDVNNKTRTLSSLQMLKNVSYDLTIPTSIPEGTYKVSLRAIEEDQTIISIFSSSYPQLIISTNENDPIQPPLISSMLGCSDIEVLEANDNEYEICLNIYELQNLEDSPFIGDLRMILADEWGAVLYAFGDSLQPGELGKYEVQPEPFMLKGFLSEECADGKYRLYIGARPINSSEYQYVSFYDFTQPYMEPSDYYYDLRIEKGEIFIDGHRFKLHPLGISTPIEDIRNTMSLVSLSGFLFGKNQKPKGITIVDGKIFYMTN